MNPYAPRNAAPCPLCERSWPSSLCHHCLLVIDDHEARRWTVPVRSRTTARHRHLCICGSCHRNGVVDRYVRNYLQETLCT